MYFSKNSRCVLQRVRFLSPTFLTTSNQNLCMKKPKDDPTKPPLRINIPKDLSQSDGFPKLIKNSMAVSDSNSKSLLKESKSASLSPNFDDDFLYKSESEVEFSQVGVDETSIKGHDRRKTASTQTFNSRVTDKSPNKEDYNEGLQTVLNEKVTEAALAEIYLNDSDAKHKTNAVRGKVSKKKNLEISLENQTEDNSNSKSLYIIIDVPQKGFEKYTSEEASHPTKEENVNPEEQVSLKVKMPGTGASRQKTENILIKKRHSFPKFDKSKSSKNFEVHEIEDESTYIFHLKFNPNHCRKPCGVGWVPEKELTTRNENFGYTDAPVKVKKFTRLNKFERESAAGDEVPKSFRWADGKKKRQNQEGKSKTNLFDADKAWGCEAEATRGQTMNDPDRSPNDFQSAKTVSSVKEKSKSPPQKLERGDFGSVRAGPDDDNSLKMYGKINGTKQEGSGLQERLPAVRAANEQKACTEASSSPAPEVTETSKVEKIETSEDHINMSNFLQSNVKSYSPEVKKQYKNWSTHAKDSYALYVDKHRRAPAKTEKSTDIYKKCKNSEYFSIHEREPIKYQPLFENRNCTKCFSSSEIDQMGNGEPSDEPQYMTIHQKPKFGTAEASFASRRKKNFHHANTQTEKSINKIQNSAKNPPVDKKMPKKKLDDNSNQEKSEPEHLMSPGFDKLNNKAADFQTSPNFVSIGCDRATSNPATYGAAFPPFLSEALIARLRFKKDFLLNSKWTKIEISSKDMNSSFSQKYKVSELSENSILFPKKESEKFDCDSLFSNKEEVILNIIKNEKDNSQKVNKIVANASTENPAEHKDKSSIDSLSVMKKVKEIIRLDLDNAVKIFKNGESKSGEELPSVVILKGDSWEIDAEELGKQMEMRKNEMKVHNWTYSDPKENAELRNDILGDKTEVIVPKYLPSKEENPNEVKLSSNHLDSVVTYNPKTNKFFISKEALEDAKSQRIKESFEKIAQNLDSLIKSSENSLEAKNGDSILVFDEESQSWRVDFTILEKREQQLQMEKELTKRSELILETFENLEKDQLSTVPKPNSKDKKTFDYKTEKWKVYDKEKKSTKSKSPFRESDAEEIRRKNSDLYENLFVTNKKETTMKKAEKIAPGLDSSKTNKESKSESSGEKKKTPESSSMKSSGSAPKNPESPKSQSILPSANQEKPKEREDDYFWEAFLKMNILPRDFREISKTVPSSKPILSKITPPFKKPSDVAPKIEEPKSKIPQSKIEVPKLKTPESKIKEPKLKTPESKIEEPKLKTPESKIEEPKLKTPESKIEEPKLKTPEKKIKEPKSKTPEGKVEDPKMKIPEKKIEDPKFKIQLPFIKDKIVDLSIKMIKPVSKEKAKTKDEKKAPPSAGAGPEKKAPPSSTSTPRSDSKSSTTSSSKEPPTKPTPPPGKTPPGKIQDPKGGKNDKMASAADHYVSDKIIEISKNKVKDNQPKIKTNKMETVKVNIYVDKRLPSKITEINLNKKCEEKAKEPTETQPNPVTVKKSKDVAPAESDKSPEEKMLYKNLEKYKTSFSDPEYEEKPMTIKSDLESNPNLKKLDNWNKTLVLHDIMKPPENIDSWLKDETDKMATLLLKILQEAANGKPKKKQNLTKTKSGDKNSGKGNPYENIRKKQEVTPENFLFRVRTVNLSLEDDKKSKQGEGLKVMIKSEKMKDAPVQPVKNPKPSKVIDAIKFVSLEKDLRATGAQLPESANGAKSKASETALEAVVDPALMSRDFSQQNRFPIEITEEIPGPEILKKISNAWKAFPILGSQMTIFTLLRLFKLANLGSSIFGTSSPDRSKRFAFTKLFTKYGPIVNVQGPLSGNVILIHKPEHLTTIFEQDVALLVRSVFDSVEKTRRDSEEKVLTINISTDWTKPEWNELKRGTNDTILRGSEKYFRTVERTGDYLVSNVRKSRNGQDLVSEDFMEEIRRWSLEGLCNVLFEKSFGFLEGRTSNMNWIMESDKLYMAIDQITRCLNNCEKGFQAWRLMATPSLTALGQAYRTISSIFQKQLYQAEINLKNKSELLKEGVLFPAKDLTFIESMLLNDGMTNEEITCNLVDIMLIGTNMMNSAMGFLLYNLAQNVKVQNKLLKELKEALPYKNSPLDYNKLQSLKYLQACLNESLRLHMPIPIFYKMLQNDVLLVNYIVPKGTYVVMDYRVSCMKEQIFDDPEKYIPERWLTDEKWIHEIHPFTSFPFCHGPRAELAKRVVEMQLLTCIAKIIRNFQIEYHYGEIQETNSIITFPDKPLKFNFIERES